MAFDVNGARAAGWTDPEILAFMRKPLRKPLVLSTPGDWSPVGRAPAPAAPFVGPRTPMNVPPPESTFQGTMGRIGAEGYQGPQYTGGPLNLWQPPDAGNLASGIENVGGSGATRALGLSQLGRFAMEAATPILSPVAASRPLSTLMGLGYGMAAQHGVESGLTSLGVQPGYAQLAGDVAGLGAGVATGLAPWERFAKPGAFPEFVRNELGEIVIRPSQGWTSTLRDLIEQKVPAKVQPAQLRGILSQASPEEVKWTGMGQLADVAQEPLSKQDILAKLSGQEEPLPRNWEGMSLTDILKMPDRPASAKLSQVSPLEIQETLRTPPHAQYGKWTLPGGEQSHELILQLPKNPGGFKHSHWPGIENPLATARFNERTTPAGEPVLFLEEVQSDWHQKGRKEGYADQLFNARQAATDAFAEWKRMAELHGPEHELTQAAKLKHQELSRQAAQTPSGAVADAPFKKDWHELVMKRMIGEAVNTGAKKLAWTTGEQQAARYDLSKHIDNLEYYPESRLLEAYDPQGKRVISETGVDPEKLADYIGQDAAKKLHEQIRERGELTKEEYSIQPVEDDGVEMYEVYDPNGEPLMDGPFSSREDARHAVRWEVDQYNNSRPIPSLRGLDLKTGGEGMKGFYDKILPDFARKYGKKFGSTVSQTEIQTPAGPVSVHSLDITPEMVRALKGGQPMFGTQIKQQK